MSGTYGELYFGAYKSQNVIEKSYWKSPLFLLLFQSII
jgi:hypothetical protein